MSAAQDRDTDSLVPWDCPHQYVTEHGCLMVNLRAEWTERCYAVHPPSDHISIVFSGADKPVTRVNGELLP